MESIKIDMQLDMTYYCNLNCIYCIRKSKFERNYKTFELGDVTKRIDSVIASEKEIKSLKIEFFGGEPTLEIENIYKIIDKYKHYDFVEFEITTNCVLDISDLILYIKQNNKKLKLSCSYDSISNKQNRCSNSDFLNHKILNNIKKYKVFFTENWEGSELSICSCLREKDVFAVLEHLEFIKKEIGNLPVSLSPVFGEFWKKESFKELHKGFSEYISKSICENGFIPPILMTNHKDYFFKLNPYYKMNNFIPSGFGIEESVVSETKRFGYKKKYNVYDINVYDSMYLGGIITLDNLKKRSTSKKVFDEIVYFLILGGATNRYKKEIYCLFDFNITYIKEFKKQIKLIKNKKINVCDFFIKKGIMIKHDLVLGEINKNYVIVNEEVVRVIETNCENSFYNGFTINITTSVPSEEKIYEILHEVCHHLIKISNVKIERDYEELICEEFIDYVFEKKIKEAVNC